MVITSSMTLEDDLKGSLYIRVWDRLAPGASCKGNVSSINVTLRLWKFSDFCSRHCGRRGWWYHVPHSGWCLSWTHLYWVWVIPFPRKELSLQDRATRELIDSTWSWESRTKLLGNCMVHATLCYLSHYFLTRTSYFPWHGLLNDCFTNKKHYQHSHPSPSTHTHTNTHTSFSLYTHKHAQTHTHTHQNQASTSHSLKWRVMLQTGHW